MDADATFGKSDFQKIRWNKLSVDGRTPNGAGVLRGWIAVAVEGKRVDGSLDKFETALGAAARTSMANARSSRAMPRSCSFCSQPEPLCSPPLREPSH
mgnify:CR=1 FL=1